MRIKLGYIIVRADGSASVTVNARRTRRAAIEDYVHLQFPRADAAAVSRIWKRQRRAYKLACWPTFAVRQPEAMYS